MYECAKSFEISQTFNLFGLKKIYFKNLTIKKKYDLCKLNNFHKHVTKTLRSRTGITNV